MSMPEYMINKATKMPIYPSNSTPVSLEMIMAKSTALVAITSFRESTEAALMVAEEIRPAILA